MNTAQQSCPSVIGGAKATEVEPSQIIAQIIQIETQVIRAKEHLEYREGRLNDILQQWPVNGAVGQDASNKELLCPLAERLRLIAAHLEDFNAASEYQTQRIAL